MINHILCNFGKFNIEMYVLRNPSFLFIIEYIMGLQVCSSMKEEFTIAGSGGTC